jgi:CubicO group peptidase (beta-lactamase class C family)
MAKRTTPGQISLRALFPLLLFAPLPAAHPDSPKPLDPPKAFDLAAIDAYVRESVRDRGCAGLSLAIVRDGKLIFAKGYGKRSLEEDAPVEADTPFAVGSLTKQFTCACVLLLAEEGKLSVDDRVAKYRPGLTKAGEISLHDLMTHTAGYPDYYPLDFVDRRMKAPVSESSLLAEYAGAKLDFEPSARWSYSNTGYVLLGSIVTKVSGKPFGQFLKERILGPLEMTHSAFEPGSDLKGRARGYTSFALGPLEPAEPEASGWLEAAGGLWASASDLARWDIALMEGRVLKPDTYRLMTTPRTLLSGHTTLYGCGLSVRQSGEETVLRHSGAISGFLALNAMIPRARSAVIVLTNNEQITPDGLHATILGLLLDDLKKHDIAKVPKINGPPAKEAALGFLHEMQSGKVDRANLGEEFAIFLTDERLAAAAPRLKALGEPESVEVLRVSERGRMEVALVEFTFKTAKLEGLLYRAPDGKIQQLLFRKP